MARRRSTARQLERTLVRAAKRRRPRHGLLRRTADDRDVLRGRLRIDPDWRRVEDGRAARLGPHERIDLRGHGRFADRDPGQVVVGWRSAGRAGGLLAWLGAVAASWWLGGWGRGPLSDARRDRAW